MDIYKSKKRFAEKVNDYFCLQNVTSHNNGYVKELHLY